MRKVTADTIELIKKFEGTRLKVYRDSAGYKTIGTGHLLKPTENFEEITQEQSDALLADDLENAELAVNLLIKVPLTDNQFGALVSFTFNVGSGALEKSTLRRLLNLGHYHEAADQLLVWNRAGGKAIPGLTKRRIAERAFFLTV